ncbi:MAG: magnesium transporter [Clostridia bacterium]|nr:magnesium transporter [Clostridia bacterium]
MAEITSNALGDTLAMLIEAKKYSAARDVLETMHPADIAAMLEECSSEIIPLLFRLLPKELAAETFVEMDDDQQQLLIQSFSDSELKEVVDELYMDDAVDLVGEMPANVVKRILRQADPEMRKMINEILKYPEDSAGSIMTTEYVSLRPEMTVEDAIKRIRRTGVDKETINTCYVTGDNRKILGIVTVRALLLADENAVMSDIMEEDVISALTTDDRESVAMNFNKYGLSAMPVVDEENRLVGIVTVDDVLDVMQEETTEDIEKMAAITPLDKPYLKTGIFETYRSRIPWLLLLMISATFTGMIITSFQNALATQIALVACIPMLMDTGGNCGSQASVTVIRGISLGEIEFCDIFRVIWKEMRVAFFCGVTLSAATFVKLILFDRFGVMVAAVVCLTLVLDVIVAKVVGCTLPLMATKVGFDPAVMASPFITTIVDAISLLIYFKIATTLLGIV